MLQWIRKLFQRNKPVPVTQLSTTIVGKSPLLNQLHQQKQSNPTTNHTAAPTDISLEDVIKQIDAADAKVGLAKIPEQSVRVFGEFAKHHRGLLYRFMLKKIQLAVRQNSSTALLFRMGNTPLIAKIDRGGFSKALTEMIDWFSKHEEYEHAARAVSVLRSHEINLVLESTSKG